jgi:hypothetical protein
VLTAARRGLRGLPVPGAANYAAALSIVAVLVGCGGDGPPPEPDEPPRALIERALAQPVRSGEVEIDAEVALEDSSVLDEPATFSASGPFELRGAAVPRFDLEFDAGVAGFGVDGELISDGDDGYVVFFGENYRLGTDHIDNADRRIRAAATAGASADPAGWIAAPRYEGSEEVEGERCHVIAGRARPEAIRRDLRSASTLGLDSPAAIGERLRSGTVELLVGADDDLLCGFGLDAELTGPGHVELDVRLSDVNEPQEIERPEGGGFQAVEELVARIERLSGVTIDF